MNTMKLEQQVCSLEYAKKLKELGAKQESLFYWWIYDNGEADIISSHQSFDKTRIKDFHFSAFTVAELGEMLPWRIKIGNRYYCLGWEKGGLPWHWISYCYGDTRNTDFDIITQEANTEANARAKMLIYLLENNLITL